MTLRFIDFKTSEPQNTEPQPATSLSVVSAGQKTPGRTTQPSRISNFEYRISKDGLASQNLFKQTGYIHLMFDVRRSRESQAHCA